MKRTITILLSFLILISCCAVSGVPLVKTSAASNLVQNGGAEDGDNGWTAYDQWTQILVSNEAHSGEKSFQIPQAWKYMSQAVNLEDGQTYKLSCYTKGTGNAEMRINTSSDGKGIDLAYISLKGNSAGWSLVQTEFTSYAAQTVYLIFKDLSGTSNSRLIDDIALEAVQASAEPLKNGGAEDGAAGWKPYDQWTEILVFNDAHSGEKSFQIPQAWKHMSQAVNLEDEQTYKLSCYTKGTGNAEMRINTSSDGKGIDLAYISLTDNNAGWSLVQTEFTSYATQKAYLIIKDLSGTANPRLIDDISLDVVLPTVDLIVNGGAEESGTGWIPYDEWTAISVSSDARSGSKSFVMPDEWKTMHQSVELLAGQEYKLTYYTKGSGKVLMTLSSKKDGTGNVLVSETMRDTNSGWSLFEKTFISDQTATFYLRFRSESSDERLVDDISLNAVSDADKTIKNGGFEKELENWSYEGETSPSITDGGCYNSAKALVPAICSDGIVYQDITVETDTDYVVEFWHKGDSDGAKWAIYDMDSNTPDTPVLGNAIASCEEWMHYQARFNSGSTKNLRFAFISSGDTGEYLIDNVSVSVAKNIVTNGDFEEALTSWNFEDGYFEVESENVNGIGHSLAIKAGNYKKISQRLFPEEGVSKYKITFSYCGAVPEGVSAWAVSAGKVAFSGTAVLYKGSLSSEKPDEWKTESVVIDLNNAKTVYISFQTVAGAKYYVDGITAVATDDTADEYSVLKEPTLGEFQGKQNEKYTGPFIADDEYNLITDSSFESGNGNWNSESFLVDGISVTDESVAVVSGSKGLKFKATGSLVEGVFYVEVKPNTKYYFTLYAKMPKWTDNNIGDVTFGVIDADSGCYLISEDQTTEISRMITVDNQINPASPDSEWHILGIDFKSNSAKRVGIMIRGACAEVYFDNMYLFEANKAKNYIAPLEGKKPSEVTNDNPTLLGCDDSINMIVNGEFNTNEHSFWENSKGFSRNNSIVDSGSSIYKNAILYQNTQKYPDRTYYIKWVDVKPNTSYTFSAKYCVVEPTNDAFFGIISGDRSNLVFPTTVKRFSLGKKDFDEECRWQTAGTVLNTMDADRIGIVVFNGGGKAYIDDLKLFETYDYKGNENGSVLIEKKRDPSFPSKLNSSKYKFENGVLIIKDKNLTISKLVSAFKNKQYISVYSADGEKIEDLSQRVSDGIQLRLMDGPEILDRLTVNFIEPIKDNTKAPTVSQDVLTDQNNDINNNLLAELIVKNAEISPSFTPENKKYEAMVEFEIDKLIVKAIPQSETATVTIEGEELTYVGKNIVKVIVHSESGLKRTYKIYVERLAPSGSQNVSSGMNTWLILAISAGAVALLGGAIVFIVIIARKKKKQN